jgi:hypothetical protein
VTNTIMTRSHLHAAISTIAIAAALSGCTWKNTDGITVIVRPCVVRGAAWTDGQASQSKVNNQISAVFSDVNTIWMQAGIGILAEYNKNGDVPIIDDPFPPGTPRNIDQYGGPGHPGDVQQSQDDSPSLEASKAVASCNVAWAGQLGPGLPGIPVVFVRVLVDPDGTDSHLAGFSPPNLSNYRRNQGKDLCDQPYAVQASDVIGRYSLVATYSSPNPLNLIPTIAHELGHDLMLAHGDGRDNDGNGRWDEMCDNLEYVGTDLKVSIELSSLMYATANSTVITPLQRKLARSAAILVPGSLGGPP